MDSVVVGMARDHHAAPFITSRAAKAINKYRTNKKGVVSRSPHPFAITVLIPASAAFVTPFSTPGRYKFGDFLKVGIPLLLLTWLTTLLVTPLIFPFAG